MAKNDANHKYLPLKDENQKLLETEKRLINEGIIFKSRLLNTKNKSQKPNTKRNNNKKDLSIKLTTLNLKKENNLINSNIPISTKRKKKSSFTNINHLSMSELSKGKIKTNKTSINKKVTATNSTRNIYSHNSYKHPKKNIFKEDSKFGINFDEKKIISSVNISPRISNIKIGNYHLSPSERSKCFLNNIKSNINMRYGQQKFNYNKWNKIMINDIFNKEINNEINQNTNPYNNNNGIIEKIPKENNDYNNYINKSYISGKNKEIQEIVIKNKKQKKSNDIPYNNRKNKNKEKIIERNNIFNYCKQMTSLAFTKENTPNFNRQTTKREKYDRILGTKDIQGLKNSIHININNNINTNLKQYNKSINKKPNSIIKIDKHSFQSGHQYSFKEIDFKNLSKHNNFNSPKISFDLKNKNKSHSNGIIKNNNGENDIGEKKINNNKNDLYEFQENSIPILNTQVIRIKNSKLMDYIKSDKGNEAKSSNEYIYQKDKNENNEDIKSKNEFCDELFNSNTDLFTEKDKGYTFDNKLEIDNTESTFRIYNNYNLDMNNINFSNYNINTTSDLNKNHKSDLPYSLKHSIFSKKITGGVIIKAKNNNNIKNNDENINLINKSYKSYSSNNNLKENKIDEKVVVFNNHKNKIDNNNIDKNNIVQSNGEYMELAKICANQEKIISNLVENVQKLNNQICDKDLYINELNNQLYSIKFDLLNTLQKTKNNK